MGQIILNGIPEYPYPCTVSSEVYDCGRLLTKCDLPDYQNTCVMRVLSGTNEQELNEYISILESHGYISTQIRSLDHDTNYIFDNGKQQIFISHFADIGRVQIIVDPCSVPEREFSYSLEPEEGSSAEYYLFGLKMDQHGIKLGNEGNDGNPNNGMLMIVKCADNSLILIDGGASAQMQESDQKRLDVFLHHITGKPPGEKIVISAWFFSHSHNDHINGAFIFLRNYTDTYVLQRILCNFPPPEKYASSNSDVLRRFAGFLRTAYPDCQEIKAHTGQALSLADVEIQVLLTHEEHVDAFSGQSTVTDYNDTTTVIRVRSKSGMSMMVLGDINKPGEEVLTRVFSDRTLKCDIVQTAHHNFNHLTKIYELVDAPIALFTQSEGGIVRDEMMKRNSNEVRKYSKIWYCAGNETVGFVSEGSSITVRNHVRNTY